MSQLCGALEGPPAGSGTERPAPMLLMRSGLKECENDT